MFDFLKTKNSEAALYVGMDGAYYGKFVSQWSYAQSTV